MEILGSEEYKNSLARNRRDRDICALWSLFGMFANNSDARRLAKNVIKEYGSLSVLTKAALEDVAKSECFSDCSPTERARLRRMLGLIPDIGDSFLDGGLLADGRLSSLSSIAAFCSARYVGDTREGVDAILLDDDEKVITVIRLAEGDMQQAEASLGQLIAALFNYGAAEFIISHNHPFRDDTKLSAEDICVTERLVSLTESFGKRLVEHIVITANGYVPTLQAMRLIGYEIGVSEK